MPTNAWAWVRLPDANGAGQADGGGVLLAHHDNQRVEQLQAARHQRATSSIPGTLTDIVWRRLLPLGLQCRWDQEQFFSPHAFSELPDAEADQAAGARPPSWACDHFIRSREPPPAWGMCLDTWVTLPRGRRRLGAATASVSECGLTSAALHGRMHRDRGRMALRGVGRSHGMSRACFRPNGEFAERARSPRGKSGSQAPLRRWLAAHTLSLCRFG